MSEWTSDFPKKDGVYLTKLDHDDDDSETSTYHVRDGKTFTPEGEQWICHGGIWKRISDLPE